MRRPTLIRAAAAALAALTAGPAVAVAADPGFLVLESPTPRQVLEPGPGSWLGTGLTAAPVDLGDLATLLPRARLRVGRPVVVRLPFAASAATVTVLRPRAALADGTLIVSRTALRARVVDGDRVSFRMSGAAGIVVVYAVDAAGRGAASGRLVARLADAPACRAWSRQLRRIDDPGTTRAEALRDLLRRRCVSPFGVPRPDDG